MHRGDSSSSSSFTSHTRQDPTKRYGSFISLDVVMTAHNQCKSEEDWRWQHAGEEEQQQQETVQSRKEHFKRHWLVTETWKGKRKLSVARKALHWIPSSIDSQTDRQTDEMTRQMLLLMDIKWYSPSGRVYNSAAVLGQTEGAFHSIPMNHRPVASSSSWLHSNGLMGVVLCIIVIALCS